MLTKDELLDSPEYLLEKYQNQIFRQLQQYMTDNGLSQKDIAEKLGVSRAYINQILNGNFNFTLKKLIELGLLIGKVPKIEFIDKTEFQSSGKGKKIPIPIPLVATKKRKVNIAK